MVVLTKPILILLVLAVSGSFAQPGQLADYMAIYNSIARKLEIHAQPAAFVPLAAAPHYELLRVNRFFEKWAQAKQSGPHMMAHAVSWNLGGNLPRLIAKAEEDIKGPLHYHNLLYQDLQTVREHRRLWQELEMNFRFARWGSDEWDELEEVAGVELRRDFRKIWTYAIKMDQLYDRAYRTLLAHSGRPGR